MVYNLVRKRGVPVLAYCPSDQTIPWPCSLTIQYDDRHATPQVAVSLQSLIRVDGFDDKQAFTLRYEGDNLVPGTMSLGLANIRFPKEWSDVIARPGTPQIRTLSLTLKTPCSVWYPRSLGSQPSKHRLDTPPFQQLARLSRATAVCILFDCSWLGHDNHERLQRLVGCSLELTSVAAGQNFTQVYRQADRSVFSEDAVARALPSIEETTRDAPPAYAYVSGKRSRQCKSSYPTPSPASITNAQNSLLQCHA